jgi:hypothetical protein
LDIGHFLNPLRIAGLGLDHQGRVAESKDWRTPTAEELTERLKPEGSPIKGWVSTDIPPPPHFKGGSPLCTRYV